MSGRTGARRNFCEELKDRGLGGDVHRTHRASLFDPHFSERKSAGCSDNAPGAREKGRERQARFWHHRLIPVWHLTGGKRHVTDATNASRTPCFNIAENRWDEALLDAPGIPLSMMPEVLDCSADLNHRARDPRRIAILGIAGDQQAATIGQPVSSPECSTTYGTGW
ncbi:MAG: FGGY family carbohydrate kinase [Nitratireductor sp.]